MNEHIDELLPFYLNHSLDEAQTALVRAHLAECPACRKQLSEWQELASLTLTHREVPLAPPLSPLVFASLERRPSLQQAAASALHLIWSQRAFISHTWLLPSLGILIGLAALAALAFKPLAAYWASLPLFAVMPIAAALTTAFLYTFEDDPAGELIAAAPTSLAALLFARLTLALAVISLMGLAGSLLAALIGQPSGSLLDLIGLWLSPMLLLSALTTVLSLRLPPRLASGAALALWGGLLILLFAERTGTPLLKFSLMWLLQPGWALFAAQILLAGLLWLGVWLWLSRRTPASLHLEGQP